MGVGMRYLHSWSMQLPAFSSTEVPFILFWTVWLDEASEPPGVVEDVPSMAGAGTRCALRSLPTQSTLMFYDFKIHNTTKLTSRMLLSKALKHYLEWLGTTLLFAALEVASFVLKLVLSSKEKKIILPLKWKEGLTLQVWKVAPEKPQTSWRENYQSSNLVCNSLWLRIKWGLEKAAPRAEGALPVDFISPSHYLIQRLLPLWNHILQAQLEHKPNSRA